MFALALKCRKDDMFQRSFSGRALRLLPSSTTVSTLLAPVKLKASAFKQLILQDPRLLWVGLQATRTYAWEGDAHRGRAGGGRIRARV